MVKVKSRLQTVKVTKVIVVRKSRAFRSVWVRLPSWLQNKIRKNLLKNNTIYNNEKF